MATTFTVRAESLGDVTALIHTELHTAATAEQKVGHQECAELASAAAAATRSCQGVGHGAGSSGTGRTGCSARLGGVST